MAIRNSPATQSTEFSPYHLLFGREMNLPFDISVIPKQHLSSDAKQQLEDVLANLKITQDLATKNMKLRQAKAKDRYDRNSKITQFRLRDLVLLRQHVVPVSRSPKLVDKYKGPYYITELGPNYTYKLRFCSTNKEVKSMINAKELKMYKDPRDHQIQPGVEINPRENNETENDNILVNKINDSKIFLNNIFNVKTKAIVYYHLRQCLRETRLSSQNKCYRSYHRGHAVKYKIRMPVVLRTEGN